MTDWEEIRLRDVSVLITKGTTPSTLGYGFTSHGVNFIKAEAVTTDGHFDKRKFAYIDEDTNQTLKRSILAEGDILFSMAGMVIGKTAVVTADVLPANTNQALGIIRLDRSKAEPRYVDYHLKNKSYNDFINSLVAQSAQPNLNLAQIGSLPILLPALDEQRSIARILGALDDKVQLNRRMNRTLEAMAAALFKSWFVDFDPVTAKAEGRQPYGMNADTAALFPSGFEDSSLGAIPLGWHVGLLTEIADVVMGASPSGDTYNDVGDGVPLVNGPVEFGNYFAAKTKWTTAPTRLSQEGDLIFCVRGSTTGRRVVADDVYCMGRGVCAIRSTTGRQAFVNQTIDSGLERLLSKTGGSVFPNLSGPDISGFEVLMPQSSLQEAYCRVVDPLISMVWKNIKQSGTLASIRDTLLPKLLSGEIRVKQAEHIIATA